ncbi:MAG: phosphodiester glycosidase family protein [Bacteroidetes bacterium]|nr:phosphodiester glycosidase family protein [Bacteroidota bacterium]
MVKYFFSVSLLVCSYSLPAQQNWIRVDSLYAPLPTSIEVWKSTSPVEGKPCIVYLVRAKLAAPDLQFNADTSYRRRLTPHQFFERNQAPLLVVNASFFSFTTHQNFNLLIQNGVQYAFNVHAVPGKGSDSLTWKHPLGSAIGITKNRRADVAWTFTDSSLSIPLAVQMPVMPLKDSQSLLSKKTFKKMLQPYNKPRSWKMNTAVGGGPVLVQYGLLAIANEEEMKFAGPAIEDRHPRTAMGYTKDGWLLVLVAEGRHPGIAEGLTLKQTAQFLVDWNCEEGLNLDGGGSSALLVNGKPTITPSDKAGARAVPGVFVIKRN